MPAYTLGLDFGTASVRVLVVDVRDGTVVGRAERDYAHGVIDHELPSGGGRLPADYALQHPGDWLEDSAKACRAAVRRAKIQLDDIVGIGVDFTSCTMLPTLADGTPLCLTEKLAKEPLAWPKLWKHHGAKVETDRINQVARERREKWLDRYGGVIGLEWFFPKILETLNHAPHVYKAADVWLEAGDWFVWQLIDGPFPASHVSSLSRSMCQAGYKAMWNAHSGYPSREYFAAVKPKLGDVVASKLSGTLMPPGRRAGLLSPGMAKKMGLPAGIPVGAAIIDAHAGVPGAGVGAPGTMVLVMGTSSCHMLNSEVEKLVPGIAGVVQDGILPGMFGYETGQACVGDAFGWAVRTLGQTHAELTKAATELPAGSGGVMALDWLNGCRTPLMDGRLSGAMVGLTLNTRPEQIYRAMLEATCFGVRWIADTLRDGGVPVKKFVASGGLPAKSPLLMQIQADVLGEPVHLAESDQSVALGAAILGCLAAGPPATGHASIAAAIKAMARQRKDLIYKPSDNRKVYAKLYANYRRLAGNAGLADTMRSLRGAEVKR